MGCGCSVQKKRKLATAASVADKDVKEEETVHVVVRTLGGDVEFDQDVTVTTTVHALIDKICSKSDLQQDMVQLIADGRILEARLTVADFVSPAEGEAAPEDPMDAGPGEDPVDAGQDTGTGSEEREKSKEVELTLIKLPGPPIVAETASGRPIQVMNVPSIGGLCHLDRDYRFKSLGGFAEKPSMRYIRTSNEDKRMPETQIMWKLKVNKDVTVYLNFRSLAHVESTGAKEWLEEGGWQESTLKSTVSTGIPNGPYSGPVFFKAVEPCTVELMGSNCSEGTYFVFVDLEPETE